MKQIQIDEIYKFKCRCCGDCCSGNMEININIYDLYKISKYLKFNNSGDLFKKDLVKLVNVQNDCWTPQINFKTVPFAFCPWLINDLNDDNLLRGFCSLHPGDKPLICKMAPAGRVVDFDKNDIVYKLTSPTESCPGMNEKSENKLSELKNDLKKELDYEHRFYQILDKIREHHFSAETMLEQFYCFDTDTDFDTVFFNMENSLKILIN